MPKLPIDKEQPDDEGEQQNCEPVSPGKHQPENQGAQHRGGGSEPEGHRRHDPEKWEPVLLKQGNEIMIRVNRIMI
ncbi:MAG: hypothetical protein ACXWKP_17635 [Bradyrhizobium sp.]